MLIRKFKFVLSHYSLSPRATKDRELTQLKNKYLKIKILFIYFYNKFRKNVLILRTSKRQVY